MPKPRNQQISLEATPFYHCSSRCVRRAHLCGVDNLTGQSYEHRRQWVEDRILYLADVFSIDLCAYAVMPNHLHVVLHINKPQAAQWTELEICARWHRLFKGSELTQKFLRQESLTEIELEVVNAKITQWRLQLCDISWFMRTLNEPIARQANAEDNCTGRFWEGRFKCQALCDEGALAACLAYVDLNPVRAKLAQTPETSDHTSIKKRIEAMADGAEQPKSLAQFAGESHESVAHVLPFQLRDYIELVDWTGRILREDKRGAIDNRAPPILDRLNIEPKQWLQMSTQFEGRFKILVGCVDKLKRAAEILGYKRLPSMANCRAAFG